MDGEIRYLGWWRRLIIEGLLARKLRRVHGGLADLRIWEMGKGDYT